MSTSPETPPSQLVLLFATQDVSQIFPTSTLEDAERRDKQLDLARTSRLSHGIHPFVLSYCLFAT